MNLFIHFYTFYNKNTNLFCWFKFVFYENIKTAHIFSMRIIYTALIRYYKVLHQRYEITKLVKSEFNLLIENDLKNSYIISEK